jgi:glycerophosphoryl diester phosphodiesterase
MRRYPENTIVAVRGAFDQGADAVEVDIRLDADAEPMVMHDETVDRTTNGHGAVAALTSAELATMNACIHSAGTAPCVVPHMADVLREAHGRGGVLLHLYGDYSIDDLRKLLLMVRNADMDRDAVFISFDFAVLLNLRLLDPVVALGLLTTHPPDQQLIDPLGRIAPLVELQAAIADSTATRAYLLDAIQREEDVGVWVAWDQALAQQASALGFRTIISDVPIDRAALSQ